MKLDKCLIQILEERFKHQNFGEINKNYKKLRKHSMKVKRIALEIAYILNLSKKQTKLIEIASMLHDIEKYNGGKNIKDHHKIGSDYVKAYLSKNCFKDLNKKDIRRIYLMIRHHKGNKYKREYKNKILNDTAIRLIEIVRAADKIAKIYKKPELAKKNIYKAIVGIYELKNKDVKLVAYEVLSQIIISNKEKQ